MLRVTNLTKRFAGCLAVDDLSFSVGPGELLALLGPNGAGKSTTINCLLGFLIPDAGIAEVDGLDCARESAASRRRLAYIPEQVNLYPTLTGAENLAYFSELAGHRHSGRRLREWLGEVGLPKDAHDRRVAGYSKGMRQKVGIAIALAKQARALLLDEPTSGLDPAAAGDFSRQLTRLRNGGVAILMATHDLYRARDVASHIAIMRHGRIVQRLAPTDANHQELEARYLEAIHP
jgi:ABC-2 type transport system ATP-binding protein